MTVQAYSASGTVTTAAPTDANGGYWLPLPSAGQYRILAFDPNGTYATAFSGGADSYESSPILTLGATDIATVDFQLQPGITVSGSVLSGSSPLSSATVAAYNLSGTRRGFATVTGGAYSLVLPAGDYKFVAYDDGGTLGPLFYPNKLSWADAEIVSVRQTTNLSFQLSLASHLVGTVLDRATGTPLPGVTVYAYTAAGNEVTSTTTDAMGRFRINVAAGTYRVVAADLAGVYAAAYLGDARSFDKSDAITLTAGQSSSELGLAMQRGAQVSGQVVAATGGAVASIHVVAYNEDGTMRAETLTNATGAYKLVLPAGTFRLAAYDDQLVYATDFYQHRNDFGSATPVTVSAGQVSPGYDFALNRAGRFSGVVNDAATGALLPGITVAAYDEALGMISSAVSNASGQYKLAVPAGTYRLVAWDAGYVYANTFDGTAANFEATAARTVAADAAQTANFAMKRGVCVRGLAMTAALLPISGIEVNAFDVDGHHVASAVTSDDGSYVLALLPGSYKIWASDPRQRYVSVFYDRAGGLASATVVVVPASGSAPTINLVLSPAGRRRSVSH